MTAALLESPPRQLPNEESTIAHTSSITLTRHVKKGEQLRLCVVDDQEEEIIILPAPVVALLMGILTMTAQGYGIALTPLHSDLTTGQAAEILNVSRPYLVKLLDAGDIPHHKVGRHRRIRREDLMHYKDRLRRKRESILDQLVQEAEEMGLYD